MNIKKIAKEISESMYPHLEVGAMDYKKKDRERLASIIETKLKNNEVLDLVSKSACATKDCKFNKDNECIRMDLYNECIHKAVC